MNQKTWYGYFKTNMNNMVPSLPAPPDLFGTIGTAIGTVTALAGAVEKFPNKYLTLRGLHYAILAEKSVLIGAAGGATTAANAVHVGRVAGLIGACLASFYVGACIGSIHVANYKRFSPTIIDYLNVAKRYYFEDSWLTEALQQHPQLVKPAFRGR